jgi:hypothetical protein
MIVPVPIGIFVVVVGELLIVVAVVVVPLLIVILVTTIGGEDFRIIPSSKAADAVHLDFLVFGFTLEVSKLREFSAVVNRVACSYFNSRCHEDSDDFTILVALLVVVVANV